MSETVKTWVEWLNNSRFKYLTQEQKEQTLRWLFQVRDKVLGRANLKPDDVLIDIGTGTGLLAFGAYDILKDSGKVIASDAFEACIKECEEIAKSCNITENFEFLVSPANDINLADNFVDVAVMRSVMVHIVDKLSVIKEFKTAGFKNIDLDLATIESTYQVSASTIDPWFDTPPAPGRPTMRQRFLQHINEQEMGE